MFIYTWIDSRVQKRQKKNFFGIEEYRETYLLNYKQFKFQIFLNVIMPQYFYINICIFNYNLINKFLYIFASLMY